MKLIILGLPKTLTEPELAALFRPHGAIAAYNLVMDTATGISKGFGFVEMQNEQDAQAAIKALHGSKIGRLKIRVKAAE